jgi:hypothetical protein
VQLKSAAEAIKKAEAMKLTPEAKALLDEAKKLVAQAKGHHAEAKAKIDHANAMWKAKTALAPGRGGGRHILPLEIVMNGEMARRVFAEGAVPDRSLKPKSAFFHNLSGEIPPSARERERAVALEPAPRAGAQ